MRTTPATLAVEGAVVAACVGRHVSAPTVRGWWPSAAPVVTAGRLQTRVVGEASAATVLLHGLVGCGDYDGGGYDALAVGRRHAAPGQADRQVRL